MEKAKKFLLAYKKIIIPIIAIFVIVILLASFVMLITLDDGRYKEGDMSSTPYAASTYVSSTKFTSNGIVFIYTNETTGEEQELTSSEMAQILWDKMIKEGSNVKNYLDSVEELEKLMNSEIITQYPKLSGNIKGLNGTVEFKRHKTDGTTLMLQYINIDIFNSYIENGSLNVLNYYSIDESGNLVIAIIDETTETLRLDDPDANISDYSEVLNASNLISEGVYSGTNYNVYSKPINYKSLISSYTMPFQYLWSLIVIGDDKDVGLELSDLVEGSQIILSIYDNVTTTKNEETYTYDREIKIDVSATAVCEIDEEHYSKSNSWQPANEWEDEHFTVNHVITYNNNAPIIDVSKADVWIVDYSKSYNNNPSADRNTETNEADLDSTDYIAIEENVVSETDGSDLNYYDKFKPKLIELKNDLKEQINSSTDISNSIDISSCKASYYKHNVNIHVISISTVTSQKYIAETPINNPKVQKKTKEEIINGTGQDNFVTILSDINHSEARFRIASEITSWLFELLETNPDTINMIDLTRYLLYMVTGNNYGVTEYDFSIYEPSAFSAISSGIYNGTIQEKVWFALKDLGLSDIAIAGAMGNIDYESGGFSPSIVEGGSGEGIGLCQWSFGRKTQLIAYANSKSVEWKDEDTQVEFLIAEISGQGPATAYASQRVSGYIKEERIASTYSDWASATTVENSTLYFMRFFESPRSRSSYNDRVQRANKYLEQFQGMSAPVSMEGTTLTGDNRVKMQSMISEAVRIANDNRYQYSQAFRNSEYYYDCSSFVSRLYQQYFGISRLDSGSGGRGTDNIKANCRSKYRKVSMSSLQQGDILWKDGHVALYIGNNQIAEAKGTSYGIVVGTFTTGRFTEAYRVIY